MGSWQIAISREQVIIGRLGCIEESFIVNDLLIAAHFLYAELNYASAQSHHGRAGCDTRSGGKGPFLAAGKYVGHW